MEVANETIGVIFADYSKELPVSGGIIHLEYLTAITTILTFIFGGFTILAQTRIKRLQHSMSIDRITLKHIQHPFKKQSLAYLELKSRAQYSSPQI